MEFKGTPAPWAELTETELELPSGIIKSGKKSIAHTLQKEVGAEQAKANAHLISAAPELLNEVIRLRNILAKYKTDSDDNLYITDSVIAKALGEVI